MIFIQLYIYSIYTCFCIMISLEVSWLLGSSPATSDAVRLGDLFSAQNAGRSIVENGQEGQAELLILAALPSSKPWGVQ